MTCIAMPYNNNPCPDGQEIYNLGKSFLGHDYMYYIFSLSESCPWVDKIFKEKHQFYTFYPPNYFPFGRGHENYNFLSPYPTDATYQIW